MTTITQSHDSRSTPEYNGVPDRPSTIASEEPPAPQATPLPDPVPAAAPQRDSHSSTAVAERPKSSPPRIDHLPPFRVLLHNDPHNEFAEVIETIVDLTPLNIQQAMVITMEAHTTGVSLLLVTHKERAELYREQFHSKRLTVTIEPAE